MSKICPICFKSKLLGSNDDCQNCGYSAKKLVLENILYQRRSSIKVCDNPPFRIITAADEKFIKGVYLLFYSLFERHPNVRPWCYDLGIRPLSPLKLELEKWGVEFKIPIIKPIVEPHTQDGWQTWNKPNYIKESLATEDQVLWVDSDIMINGDLNNLQLNDNKWCFPDHGYAIPRQNENPEEAKKLIDDNSSWKLNGYPCAGLILSSKRSIDVVDNWIELTKKIERDRKHSLFKFFDQNVVQSLVAAHEIIDGKIWNNLITPLKPSQVEIMNFMTNPYTYDCFKNHYRIDESRPIIHHFANQHKRWFDWGDMLSWK